jgi:hypothetical protein
MILPETKENCLQQVEVNRMIEVLLELLSLFYKSYYINPIHTLRKIYHFFLIIHTSKASSCRCKQARQEECQSHQIRKGCWEKPFHH